jgi:succinate dehydrogenase / fumarate reductase cytochrome b subunit
MNLMLRPARSSLGKKYFMALTGLLLTGFVIGHMAGNLLIYAGPDALNTYAQSLKDHPGLLWTARAGLFVVFVVHVALGVALTYQNTAARPTRYVYEDTLQASWASRHMLLTGLLLFAFIVYHLAHFTFGWVKTADVQVVAGRPVPVSPKNYLDLAEVKPPASKEYAADPREDYHAIDPRRLDARHDVYSMVVNGFRNPWITLSYLVAMAFLGLHLWHGGSSFFQSLGLNGPRYQKFIRAVGPVLAVIVVAGNCSIPLSVWLGIVP